jgi:uncharacterized repeat protein (TIGR01451 family)
MRKFHLLAAAAVVGCCLAGWAKLTRAQPPASVDDSQPVVPLLPPASPADKPVSTPEAETLPAPDPVQPANATGTSSKAAPILALPDNVKKPASGGGLILSPIPQLPDFTPMSQYAVDRSAEEQGTTVPATQTAPAAGVRSGKQEPAVSLEWVAPPTVKVGQPVEYVLLVRNTCPIPVQKVTVQVRLPQGMSLIASEPKAEHTSGVLLWDLANLGSKEEKRLSLNVTTPSRGEMVCQAWVTFTGSSILPIQVREPKLMVKAAGPDKAVTGDTLTLTFTATNPGDCAAEKARINVMLPPGLESARGHKLSYDLGDLQPGEVRTLQVPCAVKSAGEQRCESIVEADGLKAGDTITVNVMEPRLDLHVHGPKLRYLDRKAIYSIKVSNPGEAPAGNVFVTQAVPDGFKFVSADNGGVHDFTSKTVKWFVGDLPAGQVKDLKVELQAASAGEHIHKVVASSARGTRAEKELVTRVEGLSEVLLEVTDVDDPIEVGAETAYEIKVTNTGSKMESNLKLVCTLPAQIEFLSAQGSAQAKHEDGEVIFEPVSQLAPRGEVIFKILVKAKSKGDGRFRAKLTSTSFTEPIEKVEGTRVYED